MKQLIISDKVQKEMLTDFMIMRETKGLNEQKDRKADKKKGKKKRFYLSIFAFIMLLFVPVFVYASEMKSDGKTTQVIEEENKTVRVGYFPYSNFQEGSYGEHKQGAGYEYLPVAVSFLENCFTNTQHWGTPCCTYRYRLWSFAGCVLFRGAPCFCFMQQGYNLQDFFL